jgi:hypothetical protein
VALKLDNMNQGLTQVVLLRFRAAPHNVPKASLAVKVRFTYYDPFQRKQVIQTQESSIALKAGASGDGFKDNEVRKNYTIALLAQAIREMAVAWEMRHYSEAESLLTTAISRTRRSYPNLEDEDIARTLNLAEKYQNGIRRELRAER